MKILREVKSINPKIATVAGGVHASALAKEILEKTPEVGYIVLGEGEITFLELCRRILDDRSPGGLGGLAYRDGNVAVNPPAGLIKDLNLLPFPDRDLLPHEKYPIATVQTSRGCPYGCIFCNINSFYHGGIRLRDPGNVADEVSMLANRYNRNKVYFFGDAFTIRQDWVEELCDELGRRALKIGWGCETRVDNVSPRLLRKMSDAGCREVHFGIDYGDERILRRLGKETSIGAIEDAVTWAKDAGLFVGAFLIFNCPGEDEETMENTFRLIQKVPVDAVEINLLTPFPGTPLWDSPEKFGMRIIDYDFDYYTTKKYVMENIGFPRKRFVSAFRNILKRFNLVPRAGYKPEILNFLERDIELRAWA